MKRSASIFTLACVLLPGLQFATIDIAEARGAILVQAKPIAQIQVQPLNPVAQKVRTGNPVVQKVRTGKTMGIGKVGSSPQDPN